MRSLEDWIKLHEGFKNHYYLDTMGKMSIGYGRNLTDRGISRAEADFMLTNDILMCKQELAAFDWYYGQPPNVKDALVNMCYNLGLTKLLKFKKMIAALAKHDYTQAAIEALDSRWARQVHDRATDIAVMMREGYGS